jgi:non-ribosomal peptide synthetase component F
MQHRIAFFALLLAACASTPQDSGPPVTVQIAQTSGSPNVFYFAGPVNIQYQVSVSNPTDQAVTLRRLDLRTEGTGAYVLRTSGSPMNVKVAPKSNATFMVSAWGRALGGYIASTEPVTLFATAYFDAPGGSFVKLVHGNVWQQ